MPKMATCVCGQQVQISDEPDNTPVNCPVCGRLLGTKSNPPETGSPTEIPDSAFVETPVPESASANSSAEAPMLLRLLLNPTTIQRLLFFGGGLSVLGLIAWLVSLGVFDDPRILAVALGAGTLALLSSGWGVVLRTKYRLAGQALTFLACVVAPLNLWFYDAQNLLTVDGHLWVGGLVCSLLYMMTVWKLRDPLFLYAVEAGITLTVLLLLGDLQRATDSSALCLAMVILSTISIHAQAAFDPNHPVFNRCRFGLPLFFSGQAQLAIGMVSLLALQSLDWTLKPVVGNWSYSQIATTPWLAGSLWLAAAYLWIYSDLAVRRLSVYTYLAAVSLVLAEITLLNPYLPLEVLIIALSITALVVQLMSNYTSERGSRLSFVASSASISVGGVALLIGVLRHFEAAIPVGIDAIQNPLLFAVAMLTVAANLCYQGVIQRSRSSHVASGCWIGASLSLWLGLMHGLDVIGVQTLVQQSPLLTLVPLAIVLLAPRLLKREMIEPAVTATHAMAILGLILSTISVESAAEWSQLLASGSRDPSTLYTGLLFMELAVLYFATRTAIGSRWLTLGFGGLCTLVSGWKLLVFVDLPEAWYGPLLAGIGIVLTIVERNRSFANQQPDSTTNKDHDRSTLSPLSAAADLTFVLGELVAFFQTLPWLIGPAGSIPVLSLSAVLLTAALSMVGSLVSRTRSMRGWHGFAAAMIALALAAAWIRTLHLADYQKLELVLEFLGLVWLGAGFAGRLHETDRRRNGAVSLALWAGSIMATAPVLFCMLMHRWSVSGPSLPDEIGLITITMLMVAIGCVLQLRATTTFGGLTLGVYLAVLFGHLAYHPQIAIGVYLAAGGSMIFLTGVVLSIYRDRLLALPSKIANRQGIFQIIDWR